MHYNSHNEFNAVSPVITAKVSIKEGVSENNKYEVLEQYIDKNNKTAYKRVGDFYSGMLIREIKIK